MSTSTTICPSCNGTGVVDAVEPIECAACDGSGSIMGNPCECCQGTGEQLVMVKAYCPTCRGEI